MRTTYEDLLQVARRRAVEAEKAAEHDTTDLIAGWQATLTAACHHFRWLRLKLVTSDFVTGRPPSAQGPMYVLAQSIGAGADLLAGQDGITTIAFDNQRELVAARSELAAITAIGARAVMTRLEQSGPDAAHADLQKHLIEVTGELEFLTVRRSRTFGDLGGLSTSLPAMSFDEPSAVMRLAALWQTAHETTQPGGLLTRDLRSTTAQLRTVCGYVSHLATLLGSATSQTENELRTLESRLRAADIAAKQAAQGWRTRLSDINGRSDGPAELTFTEMLQVLRRWLQEGDRLRRPPEVMPDEQAAASVRDVLDEMLHAAHRVAAHQRRAVARLIDAGRLFVPRPELAKRDPEFLLRPTVWLMRYPQPHWIRTNHRGCFDELTGAIAETASQLKAAAAIARRLSGSTGLSRPTGPAHAIRPYYVRKSLWRPAEPTYAESSAAMSSEATGPER